MSQFDDEPTTGSDPLRTLGKQLPWYGPDAARRESVRSSLLVAASETAPLRRGRAPLVIGGFIAGALAAAAVAIVVVRTSTPAPSPTIAAIAPTKPHQHYARIESSSVARLEHTSVPTSTGTDEIVRIRSGAIRLAVPAVRAGDRVRAKTGNADIEGTGAYEVVVTADVLTRVKVTEGTVTVLVDGQKSVFLSSGETWAAPVVTADLSPLPPPRARTTPPARATPAPTPSIAPVTSTEQHFRAGWALLREANYAAAAEELGRAAVGDEPLASDARYFQAVAWTKAGRPREAEAALVAFLDRDASSARRGRAAVMLGRLIAARGDTAAARAWFTSALDDPDPSVATAAKSGLASMAGRAE